MAFISLRSVVRSTFQAYKKDFKTLFAAGFIISGIQVLFFIAVHLVSTLFTPALCSRKNEGLLLSWIKKWFLSNGFSVEYFCAEQVLMLGLLQLIVFCIGFLLYFGLVSVALKSAHGKAVSIKDLLVQRTVWVRALVTLLAYTVSALALVFLALACCLISAILFFRGTFALQLIGVVLIAAIIIFFLNLILTYSLSLFCSIDRPVRAFKALKLSGCLVQAHRLRMVALFVLSGVVAVLVGSVVSVIAMYTSFSWVVKDTFLFTTLVQVFSTPFNALLFAHFYRQLYAAKPECEQIV